MMHDGLNPWKPGQSGNPAGRPKSTIAPDKIAKLISELFDKTVAELQKMLADPKTCAKEAMFASVIIKAIEQGDPNRVSMLLDRVVGRVKEIIDTTIRTSEIVEGIPADKLSEIIRKANLAA